MITRARCVALALMLAFLAPGADRAEEAAVPAAPVAEPAAAAAVPVVPSPKPGAFGESTAPVQSAPEAPAPVASTPEAPAAPPVAAAPVPPAPAVAPAVAAPAAPLAAPAPAAPVPAVAAKPAPVPRATPDVASANDVARFLAGLQPPAGSPLAPQAVGDWTRYARSLDSAFGQVEQRQLTRIRAWSAQNLPQTRQTLLYFFSGPDFLYASAFFPKAKTYVLAGLEPVGAIPDPARLKGNLAPGLRQIQSSLTTILNYSFFKTADMKTQLQGGQLNGTLPILYVFLARTGHTVRDVELVRIDAAGAVQKDEGPASAATPRGVKIAFSGADGEVRTLYYFATDLSNSGVQASGFLTFAGSLTPADAFIKSASYLLHSGNFTRVRDFLLASSTAIVQDDSGVPITYFDPKQWELRPFGRYAGPISLFAGRQQAGYASLFRKATPIDFGIGYRWRANESNLLVAIRKTALQQSEK